MQPSIPKIQPAKLCPESALIQPAVLVLGRRFMVVDLLLLLQNVQAHRKQFNAAIDCSTDSH